VTGRAKRPSVAGFCPMGCGETLYLNHYGYVACWAQGCPRPGAVKEILADPETEHIVVLAPTKTFNVKHPLRERIEDQLLGCQLAATIRSSPGIRGLPAGRYRVIRQRGTLGRALADWSWHSLQAQPQQET